MGHLMLDEVGGFLIAKFGMEQVLDEIEAL
jgi:hypothetical protein